MAAIMEKSGTNTKMDKNLQLKDIKSVLHYFAYRVIRYKMQVTAW